MNRLLNLTSAITMGFSLIAISPAAQAADYTQVFSGTTTGSGSFQLWQPLKGAAFYNVASKYNQPRIVGTQFTNPHRGTDLIANYSESVYAIWDGVVVHAGAGQTYEIDISLDINGDGLQNDNAYVRYDHLSDIRVYTGQKVFRGDFIGKVGNEGNTVAPHLHFGVMKQDAGASGRPDYWVRNEPFYRHIYNWNYGQLLDFMSYSTWNGSVASLVVYAYDDGTYDPVNSGDVVIYHRKQGETQWKATSAQKSGDTFLLDFRAIYPVGTQVNWMARAFRSSLPANVYRCAYHQPKFAQPDCTPSSAYSFDYFINTVQ